MSKDKTFEKMKYLHLIESVISNKEFDLIKVNIVEISVDSHSNEYLSYVTYETKNNRKGIKKEEKKQTEQL